jgi:hypothetical protein
MIGTGSCELAAEMGEPGYEGDEAQDSLTRWIWWWKRLMREKDERDEIL